MPILIPTIPVNSMSLGACPTMKHRHKTHTAGYDLRILASNTSSILLKLELCFNTSPGGLLERGLDELNLGYPIILRNHFIIAPEKCICVRVIG